MFLPQREKDISPRRGERRQSPSTFHFDSTCCVVQTVAPLSGVKLTGKGPQLLVSIHLWV